MHCQSIDTHVHGHYQPLLIESMTPNLSPAASPSISNPFCIHAEPLQYVEDSRGEVIRKLLQAVFLLFPQISEPESLIPAWIDHCTTYVQ